MTTENYFFNATDRTVIDFLAAKSEIYAITNITISGQMNDSMNSFSKAFYSPDYYRLLSSIDLSNMDTSKILNTSNMFFYCSNLVNVAQFNTSNVTNMSNMFRYCNNLSNASVQNIINMCINSNVPSNMKNLYTNNIYSPFYQTKFNTMYYSNRQQELTTVGWNFEPYGEEALDD